MKIVNEIKSYGLPEGAIFEKSISNLTETRAVVITPANTDREGQTTEYRVWFLTSVPGHKTSFAGRYSPADMRQAVKDHFAPLELL